MRKNSKILDNPQPPSPPDISDEIHLPPEEDKYCYQRDGRAPPYMEPNTNSCVSNIHDHHTVPQTPVPDSSNSIPTGPPRLVRKKNISSHLKDYELY